MIYVLSLIETYSVSNLLIGPVRLEGIPSTNMWSVIDDIVITWNDKHDDVFGTRSNRFTIPKGMTTDLASVPLRLQGIVSACGVIKESAVMHDGLYQYRPILSTGVRIGRAEADWMLYYGCVNIGKMSHDEAWAVYTAVRLGGSRIWHSHDKDFGVA